MDAQAVSNIIIAVTALASVAVGALITYFVESRRQKGEMERLKLAWKREDRQKSLEPIKKYLDELRQLVGASWFSTAWDIRTDNERKIDATLRSEILKFQRANAALHLGVSDPELGKLLRELQLDPDEISISDPYYLSKDVFDAAYAVKIRAAYKRLEELSSEF